MQWNELESRWTEFSGSAAAHWSKLTNMDLADAAGKHDMLVKKVQTRYGLTQRDAEKEVEEWRQGLQNLAPLTKSH